MQAAMSAVTGGVASHAAHAYTEDFLFYFIFCMAYTGEINRERERESVLWAFFSFQKVKSLVCIF
jgi:hypothetical protein